MKKRYNFQNPEDLDQYMLDRVFEPDEPPDTSEWDDAFADLMRKGGDTLEEP